MKLRTTAAIVLLLSAPAIATTFPCSITVEGFDYDLCPLLHGRASWNISTRTETPPTITVSSYAFSLTGPLQTNKSTSHLHCAPGTWICLTVEYTTPDQPSEPPRVLHIVSVAGGSDMQPTARLGPPVKALESVPSLIFHLHGGSWANRKQKAVIQFYCGRDAEEPSKPQFSWSWNGTHAFTWTSRHACPRKPPGAPPPRQPDSDNSEEPPNDSESNKDTVLQDDTTRSPLMLFIVFVTTCFILLFLYLYMSRSLAYARFTATYYSGFRPPAARLLRWAQQAGFDDEDSELDYMVNSKHASCDHDFDSLEGGGEEIPLTPSPRHGNKGSAPAVIYGSFGQLDS